MKARICAVVLVAAVVTACGEPDYVPKETTLGGDFNGVTFPTPYAIFDSEEQSFGRNSATVFISNHPNACPQIQSRADNRSVVYDDAGVRMASLVIHVPAQSAAPGHRSDGVVASMDPGCIIEAATDGGTATSCGDVQNTADTTVWTYETDSVRADDNPRVKARFDARWDGGQRFTGTIVAQPCAGVKNSCSMDPTTALAFLSIVSALILGRRRRAL